MTPEPPRDDPYRPPERPPDMRPPDLYGPIGPVQPPVRVRILKIVGALGLILATLIGAYYVARAKGWLTPVAKYQGYMDGDGQAGIKSSIRYPVEPAALKPAENHSDPDAEWKRKIERLLAEMMARLAALENAPKAKTTVTPTTPAAPPQQPRRTQARSMLFISNKVEEKKVDEPGTYLLAPGATKIACTVETAMNSDVADSYFTAKVRNHIYDTATGHHLLVPQGSTILGRYHSGTLLYGNERLPTTSLTLALPNGKSVDIGDAPVMDQLGRAGLVSEVNQHYWRLFSSIIVIGVLRGGQQAIATELAGAGAVGAVGSGIAGTANQAGQTRIGRALDTRPTITVNAGEPCNVLLVKPLSLPAYGS
jgi:type IV secretory pathway VirB10-like protein